MTKPILNCNLHDYLEIACLFKIEVELLLLDGSSYIGIASTTRCDNTEEFLTFQSQENEKPIDIPILLLESMRAIRPNTHFDKVVLSSN